MRLLFLASVLAAGLFTARDAQAAKHSPLEHNWATVGGFLGHRGAGWATAAETAYGPWGVGAFTPARSIGVSVHVIVPVTVVCPNAAPTGASAGLDIYRATPKEIVLVASQGPQHPVD